MPFFVTAYLYTHTQTLNKCRWPYWSCSFYMQSDQQFCSQFEGQSRQHDGNLIKMNTYMNSSRIQAKFCAKGQKDSTSARWYLSDEYCQIKTPQLLNNITVDFLYNFFAAMSEHVVIQQCDSIYTFSVLSSVVYWFTTGTI